MWGARSEFFTNGRCDPKAFSPLAWSQEICQESLGVILMRGDLGKRCGSEDGEVRYSGHLNRAVGQSPPKARLPLPQPAALCVLPESTHSQAACIGGWGPAEGDGVVLVLSAPPEGVGQAFHLGRDPKGSLRKGEWAWTTHSSQWGLSRAAPSQALAPRAAPDFRALGKAESQFFFKGIGFIPALGGDTPNWQ